MQNGVEHEFYERNLEEAGVDGFLMLAMTESDLVDVACVDSVAARRRLVRAVLDRLDAEGRAPNSWPAVLAMAQVQHRPMNRPLVICECKLNSVNKYERRPFVRVPYVMRNLEGRSEEAGRPVRHS